MENISEGSEDDDFIEFQILMEPQHLRQRDRHPNFDRWSEREFFNRFRLSKDGAAFVLDIIRPHITTADSRGHPVSPEEKLLTALSFYASGAFFSVCGDRHDLPKSTVCRIVHQVSDAIARLANQFIGLPESEIDKTETRRKFHAISRFPSCIGALDCTHVRIISPGGENAEFYRNRKSFFSINVQTVADADLRITNIVARWPGSSHDATIFHNSTLKVEINSFDNDVILADSGYPLMRNLITKIPEPTTRAERLFNEAQIRTRNVVERSYGVWKRRFPVLANGLRVKLERCEAIIVATAVLHNIAIMLHKEVPDVDEGTQHFVAIEYHHIPDPSKYPKFDWYWLILPYHQRFSMGSEDPT